MFPAPVVAERENERTRSEASQTAVHVESVPCGGVQVTLASPARAFSGTAGLMTTDRVAEPEVETSSTTDVTQNQKSGDSTSESCDFNA